MQIFAVMVLCCHFFRKMAPGDVLCYPLPLSALSVLLSIKSFLALQFPKWFVWFQTVLFCIFFHSDETEVSWRASTFQIGHLGIYSATFGYLLPHKPPSPFRCPRAALDRQDHSLDAVFATYITVIHEAIAKVRPTERGKAGYCVVLFPFSFNLCYFLCAFFSPRFLSFSNPTFSLSA